MLWGPFGRPMKRFFFLRVGVHLEVSFHYRRSRPRLIINDIDPDGDLEKMAPAPLLFIVAIILMLILKGRKIPMPNPDPRLIG
jgi:hypothetical protein